MLIILMLVGLPASLLAQDQWKVQVNDKQVLNTSLENPDKNVIRINASQLAKKKNFCLTYTEKSKKKDWQRYITVYGENDMEIYKQTGTRIKVKNSMLAEWFQKSKQLKIYTWSLPTDPKLQQTIRVRRVHLVTLVSGE